MFFRLQRLTVYFAKLLESEAHPLWALDDPINPRSFARQVTKRVVSQAKKRDEARERKIDMYSCTRGVSWKLLFLMVRCFEAFSAKDGLNIETRSPAALYL